MRRRLFRTIAAAAAAVTITGGVAGCGVVNKQSPQQKVSKAFSSFQDADSATFTLKVNSDAASIKAINSANGDGEFSAGDLQTIDKILAGDVTYSVHAADGKKLGDTSDQTKQLSDLNSIMADPQKLGAYLKAAGDFSFVVHLSGDSLVEVRFRNGVVYARADVDKIASLAGGDTSGVDSALDGLPASLAPLKQAAKGQWISLDLPQLIDDLKSEGLLDGLTASGDGSSIVTPTVDAGAVQKLINDLKTAYSTKVTVKELGNTSRGDECQLSAPVKAVAQSVQDDVIAIAGDESASAIKDAITQIPEGTFNLNVWVKDDKLSGVALDLTQFLNKKPANAKLALDVAIQMDTGDIQVPSGATAINAKAIIADIRSGAFDSALTGGSSGSGFDDSSSFALPTSQ